MSRLLIALVAFTYFTIVLGSWVRNAGAGLSCPDWPLCHGQIIPPMEYRIMLEYFHRLAAAMVSILLLVVGVAVLRNAEYRRGLGKWIGAAFFFLIVQITLGMLTVTRLLQWEVVATHLGIAVIFLSCILGATVQAYRMDSESAGAAAMPLEPRVFWTARLAAIVVFAQILLGGSVSSHYAGLACPDFPTCHGDWFPGFSGQVGIQFLHRIGAVLATSALVFFLWVLSRSKTWLWAKYRYVASLYALLVLQWGLGIGMIHYGASHSMTIPEPFSVAHLAIGVMIFILIMCANYEFHFRKLP